MSSEKRKLISIITEAAIEVRLCEALTALGARGYTVTDARGSGSRGVRNASWSSSRNIRVEIVCDEAIAARIAEYLRENYFEDYAMIMFEGDVKVLRLDKF